MTSKIVVNNIEADSGINTVTFGGDISGNFVGNVNTTGVSTFSDTVNVGAGKSVRIFGSASGYSDLIAPAVAGDQTFTLPGTGGVLDRLNRAGNVLQVVQNTYSTSTEISSTSYVDSGLTASITPTSASSKILVLVSLAGDSYRQQNAWTTVTHNIVRGSTQITEKQTSFGAAVAADTFLYGQTQNIMSFLDSPNSTSSITYKVQGKLNATGNSATIRYQMNGTTSVMLLLEVAA